MRTRPLPHTLVFGLALALTACSRGAPAPSPSSMTRLCREYSAIKTSIPPLLDRLDAGKETRARYQDDQLIVAGLANRLYEDAAPFAEGSGHLTFETANELSTHLNQLVYGYFMFTDPSEIDPRTIVQVRDDLVAMDRAIARGLIPCAAQG